MEPTARAHDRAARERAQVEPLVVEQPTRLRIGERQHLEAAVEQEAVDAVRANAPAHTARGLQHEHLEPGVPQRASAREAGDAGADDDRLRPPGHAGDGTGCR